MFPTERLRGTAPYIWAILAMVLTSRSLFSGFQIDDWQQLWVLQHGDPLWDLFAFLDGDPAHNAAKRDTGELPWWAADQLKIRFMRPITALTHMLDHAIAPRHAGLAHLHSVAWLGLLTLAVGALYRSVHGATALASLAALLFAVDDAHGIPTSWLANRNALVTATLGTLCILAWRERERVPAWVSPVLFALALLAGEAAVGTLAYLAAHVLCLDDRPWRDRLRSLAPIGLIVVVWRIVYRTYGFGTAQSGMYLDPLADPLAYLQAFPTRVTLMLADQFLSWPSSIADFLSAPRRAAFAWGAALVVAGIGVLLAPLRHDRHARFWALGCLLSLVPAAATFPANRMLTFASIGGAALVALLAQHSWHRRSTRAFVGFHLVVSPFLLMVNTASPESIANHIFDPCERTTPDTLDVVDKRIIFINANDLCTGSVVQRRRLESRHAPKAVWLLSSALYEVTLRRVDDHTLRIELSDGMQSTPADRLTRADELRFAVGDQVHLDGMTITIRGNDTEGRVNAYEARLDLPLDDPRLVWMATRDLSPVPIELPDVGAPMQLPSAF